jgi:hypothetical protein
MSPPLSETKEFPKQVIDRKEPCTCGSNRFREAHRLARKNKVPMIMFECIVCGEYVL